MGKSPKDTGGPVVKTGPTSGQNRSRNKDGSWRKKRSDSGKSKKKSGGLCFLTTAACNFKGLPDDCHQLETLRAFRDSHLLNTEQGKSLVNEYYAVAPKIVRQLHKKSDYEYIWGVVSDCVKAIEEHNFEHATSKYKHMVEKLRNKFKDIR